MLEAKKKLYLIIISLSIIENFFYLKVLRKCKPPLITNPSDSSDFFLTHLNLYFYVKT